VALTQTGGTVFNVANGGTTSGIDLDVTGGILHTFDPDTGLFLTGNGTMRLDSINTYTSGTTVSNGATLILNNGGGSGCILGSLTIKPGGTVTLNATDAFGYNSGAAVTSMTDNGGTLNIAVNGNNGYLANFFLTGATVSSTGGGAFNFGPGESISNLASSTTTLFSAPIETRGTTLTFGVASGSTPGGIDLNVSGAISTGAGGAGITKAGAGTLELSGTNTFTGTVAVSSGTLLNNGLLPGGTPINVTGGVLGGTGTNGGIATISSGAAVTAGYYGWTNYGTNTFSTNLILASGALADFDLGTVYNGTNDLIVVGGNLTASGNVVHIHAPSTLVNLDTNADYVLVTVTGTITGSVLDTPIWDVAPANSANFTVVTGANTITLHYTAVTAPSGGGTASPATLTRNQSTFVAVTVTNGSDPTIGSVILNAGAINPADSSVSLVQSNSSNVYTNTVTVSPGTAVGGETLPVTITDSSNNIGLAFVSLTVTAASQTWDGAGSDDNWTTNPNWLSGAGPGYVGDAVVFDGTTNLTPNMNTNYSVTGVTFNSTAGSFDISASGGNTLTLTGAGVQDNATNAQTLNVPITLGAAQTFNAAAGSLTLGQAVNNSGNLVTVSSSSNVIVNVDGVVSGAGGLTKNGAGTVALSGVNSYAGTTTVNAGILSLTGNGTITNFSVPNGASLALLDGATAGAQGAIYQSGANTLLYVASGGAGPTQIGGAVGAYGYYNFSGGNISLGAPASNPFAGAESGEFDIGGSSGGAGTLAQFDMSGGTFTYNNSGANNFGNVSAYFITGRGAAGETNVVNISGGTVSIPTASTDNGADGLSLNWGANGDYSVVTISGTGQFIESNRLVRLNFNGGAANTAILNLNSGGLLQALGFSSVANKNLNGVVNFNGGTLMAGNAGSTTFLNNVSGLASANVYSGGAIINDNGLAITISQPLIAPAGNGVTAIPLASGGSNYIAPPMVIISGGGGANATATAQINTAGGVVTNILITSPGTGYTSVPTVTLLPNGGGTGASIASGSVTIGPDGGGLTKLGSGTLTLTAANTYTGSTIISNGALALGVGGSIAGSSGIVIAAGAAFNVSALSSPFTLSPSTPLTGNGAASPATITGAPGGTVDLRQVPITLNYDGSDPALSVSQGTLSLGTNAFTVNTTSPLANGIYTIVNASSPIADGGSYTVSGTAIGVGHTGTIAVSGNNVNLIIAPPESISFLQFTAVPAIVSGTNLAISGTNTGAGTAYLLTSTNVAAPLSTWTPVWTNVFGSSGSFTKTVGNAVNPATTQQFYTLSTTNK
jgi:autotransporter-associated beta strand protein